MQYVVTILKIYLPIFFGTSYVLGYEKKKLENLLKFFILEIFLTLIEALVKSSFQTSFSEFVMIPIFLYLTLFHYAYSSSVYDIFFAPLFYILIQMFDDMNRNVQKQRLKAEDEVLDGKLNAKRSDRGYFKNRQYTPSEMMFIQIINCKQKMTSANQYVTLTSNDGFSFVVQSKLVPANFKNNLSYPSSIVEILIQYLYYRYLHQGTQIRTLPKFQIQPKLALQVLKASIELGV